MFVLIFNLLLILLLSLAVGGGDGGGGGGGGGGSGEDIDVLLINPLLRFIGDEDVRVDAVVDRLIADIVANPKLSPVADDDSDGDDGSGCLIVAGNKSNISNVFKSVEFKILNGDVDNISRRKFPLVFFSSLSFFSDDSSITCGFNGKLPSFFLRILLRRLNFSLLRF
jgi:hypothetical protein